MTRGEIWMASLDPIRGSEQAGTRPVLILQADPLNQFLVTVVAVPLTTNLKWGRYDFCVFIPAPEGGLTADSVALCQQIRVADKSRFIRLMGQVTLATLMQVEQAVGVTLGM